MSLVDKIDSDSDVESGGEGSLVDAIVDAGHSDGTIQPEEQGDAHTEGSDAGTAASDLGPEGGDKQQNEDSLVNKLDPEEESGEGDETDKSAETSEDGEKKGEEEESSELSDEDKAALEADLLGSSEIEPEGDPKWKDRYDESLRYAHQLEQEQRDKEAELGALLETLGRKIITTEDGLALTVSDEAKDFKAEDVDVASIVNGLSEAEMKLFGSDEEDGDPKAAAEVIAKKVASVFASKVPPVTATPDQEVLAPRQRDEVYADFISEKLRDGNFRFPDCEKPEIKGLLQRALRADDDRMTALYESGLKDKNLHSAMLELAYLRVQRVQQARLSMAAGEKQIQTKKQEEIKKGPSVSGSGSGNAVHSNKTKSKSQAIESFFDDVQSGGNMLHPEY